MKINEESSEPSELKFIEGGAELLDTLQPLWKKLNALHAEKSTHFAETFAKTSFSERKLGLENKAITGQLLVILAITKADECIAYCACSVEKEGPASVALCDPSRTKDGGRAQNGRRSTDRIKLGDALPQHLNR